MKAPSSANYSPQLFKSGQRGVIDSTGYKCLSTFNFGNYSDESRQPFGALQFVNDVSVAPGNAVYFNRHETIQDVIIPVKGNITYKNLRNTTNVVDPEYILFLDPGTDHACEIQNSNEEEWINYLHLGIKPKTVLPQSQATTHQVSFKEKNSFAPLHIDKVIDHSYGYTGVFSGSTKGNYSITNENNGIFVYVINGAFNVEGHLLESRDGLSLRDIQKIDLEALSDNAIIMLLEVPLTI